MLERNVKKRIDAKDALDHVWMQRLASQNRPNNVPNKALSDICPIDPSVRIVEQTS